MTTTFKLFSPFEIKPFILLYRNLPSFFPSTKIDWRVLLFFISLQSYLSLKSTFHVWTDLFFWAISQSICLSLYKYHIVLIITVLEVLTSGKVSSCVLWFFFRSVLLFGPLIFHINSKMSLSNPMKKSFWVSDELNLQISSGRMNIFYDIICAYGKIFYYALMSPKKF